MKFLIATALCFSLALDLTSTARADFLSVGTVEAIVSVLNGAAPEKKTRNSTKQSTPHLAMTQSLRRVLKNGELRGKLLEEVIECALEAHFGSSYVGKGCQNHEIFTEIQNQILLSAESNKGRTRKLAKIQTPQIVPLSPRVKIQVEPVAPLFVAANLKPTRSARGALFAQEETPTRSGSTRSKKRALSENDSDERGKQFRLDEPVGDEAAFVSRTPRVREEADEDGNSTPKKRGGRREKHQDLYQEKIPPYFENLSPLKFKVNHLQDPSDRRALAAELELEWQKNVNQKREFLDKLLEKFGTAPVTAETAKAIFTSIKVAENPKLADTLDDVDLEFAKQLGAFPDFSAKKGESVTGSFLRRTKKTGDPGAYFTTYSTAFRYPYERRGLPAETPIALKVMLPEKWKVVLDLERKKLNKGVDRSVVAMILLNGRTDYIPQLYGLSMGWRLGEETSRKLLWTEVEWVPETAEKVLATGELIPEWLILQILYDEVQLRNLGICVADWKGQNVGFVNDPNPRTLTIAGQPLTLPAGRRLKRMDPGKFYFVQPLVGRLGEFHVPDDCAMDLTGWTTPSEELNQALPGYVDQLNRGDTRFLYSQQFLDHFLGKSLNH